MARFVKKIFVAYNVYMFSNVNLVFSDILKILVATDLHVGFMEKDPVRGEDSFIALEEILKIGKDKKVDFVLLGGDLFHENKPSRRCIVKVMDLFRRYSLGPNPVKFQIVSDQSLNFPFPCVSFIHYCFYFI